MSAGDSTLNKKGTQIAKENTSEEAVRAMGADGFAPKSAAAASGAQPPSNQASVIPTTETTAGDGKDGTSGLSAVESSSAKDGTQIAEGSTSVFDLRATEADSNAPKSAAAASGSQPPSNQASVMPTTDTTAEDGKDATSGLSAGESFPAKDGTQIAEETTSVADVRAMGADGSCAEVSCSCEQRSTAVESSVCDAHHRNDCGSWQGCNLWIERWREFFG